MTSKQDMNENAPLKLVDWVIDKAIEGVPPLCSAEMLAKEFAIDRSYDSTDARVKSLIKWETSKNFTTGFLTGLGGLLTMPVTVPTALGAAWIIQARMAAAIAVLYGHDPREDRVRTFVLLSLAGDAAKEVVKRVGIEIGNKSLKSALTKIPGRLLIEINKKVGFRLLTKAGEKGAINLLKAVPIAGGVVGGTVDAVACRTVGNLAINLFKGPPPAAQSLQRLRR